MSVYSVGGHGYDKPQYHGLGGVYGLGQTTTGDDEWTSLSKMSAKQRLDLCMANTSSLACEYIVGHDATVYQNPELMRKLCNAGAQEACRMAGIQQEVEDRSAEYAAERERQAQAEREAIAQRLRNVGKETVASAVEDQADLEYIKVDGGDDIAIRIDNPFSELLSLDYGTMPRHDLLPKPKSFYDKNKYLIWGGTGLALIAVGFAAMRRM